MSGRSLLIAVSHNTATVKQRVYAIVARRFSEADLSPLKVYRLLR